MEVLEHFYLKTIVPIKIGPIDISITNLTLSLFAGVGLFIILLLVMSAKPRVIPRKRQVIVEFLLDFIRKRICYNVIGPKEGDRWVPLISTIFIFVLASNLIGLVPGAYTPTANPVFTLVLAIIVFFTVHITNLIKNGIRGYLRSYAPRSIPGCMLVIVVPIELISTIAKPFSLFIRLFANMLAGHTIIYVILGLIIYFKTYLLAIAAVPFAAIMMLLELFVACVQAYVFAILTALYIGEAVNPRH
ncbi:MAG: ATP synthase subunit a [Actinobacteria bacterium ADurb.Bin346]|nr:MAG: ATP synthase subunit a [Actinobacteria bacterium ADurb.Bin346]